MIKRFLAYVLSDFKWYRRNRGGTWYMVGDPDVQTGFAGPIFEWTRVKPADETFIKTIEIYKEV